MVSSKHETLQLVRQLAREKASEHAELKAALISNTEKINKMEQTLILMAEENRKMHSALLNFISTMSATITHEEGSCGAEIQGTSSSMQIAARDFVSSMDRQEASTSVNVSNHARNEVSSEQLNAQEQRHLHQRSRSGQSTSSDENHSQYRNENELVTMHASGQAKTRSQAMEKQRALGVNNGQLHYRITKVVSSPVESTSRIRRSPRAHVIEARASTSRAHSLRSPGMSSPCNHGLKEKLGVRGRREFLCHCGIIFPTFQQLKYHFLKKTQGLRHTCPFTDCRKQFLDSSGLLRHSREKHEHPVFSCNLCYSQFFRKEEKEQHLEVDETCSAKIRARRQHKQSMFTPLREGNSGSPSIRIPNDDNMDYYNY